LRARNIKPGFFKNEDLSDCDLYARLLFIGLWCLADREGRLEYRPKRIKAEIFPYDNVSIEKMIKQLSDKNFIHLYSINNENYIQILNFTKHQNCHTKEQPSTIQAPCLSGVDNVISTIQAAPLTESLLPITESPLLNNTPSADFLLFWKAYPNKAEKKYAWKCWKKLNGTRPSIEILLEAIRKQTEWRENANGEFRPEWKNPATWLNKGCWDDDVSTTSVNSLMEWAKKSMEEENAAN
jgi:protoporphyrinogen oxidase